MDKLLLKYINDLKDDKDYSFDRIVENIKNKRSKSTVQRVFAGLAEPTMAEMKMYISEGLHTDPKEFFALAGEQELAASEHIGYKGTDALLAQFASEKEAMRQEFADRLAHAKEMRIAEQAAFKAALDALEDKYSKGTAYLKGIVEEKNAEIEALTKRAVDAEAIASTLSEKHRLHCVDIHRRYRLLSWGCIAVVLVALALGWFIPPPYM